MRVVFRSSVAASAAVTLAAFSFAACSDNNAPLTAPTALALGTSASSMAASLTAEHNGAVDVIVTFDDSTSDPQGRARGLAQRLEAQTKHTYSHALKGFAARMSPMAVAQLERTAGVARVEIDGVAHVEETITPRSWGQDRLDQRALPLDNAYSFASNGSGVRVYIIDTGINGNHQEFAGRMLAGYSGLGDGNTSDCHGHGTHVAGTAAGASVGVAPGASIVPVRVAGCDGSVSWSTAIAGLDWVAGQKKSYPTVPMVANMSLGGTLSASLNDAVARTVQAGVVVAVSAGNNGTDACSQSPAAAPSALTVGATESNDWRAGWSNYGSCVDIFAPGGGILSAYYGTTTDYTTMSGTSMASPHVTGVAALILSSYPTYSPADVRSAMVAGATANVVSDAGSGSPNLLLSSMYGAVSTPTTPTTTTPTTTTPTPQTGIVGTLTVGQQSKRNNLIARLRWSGVSGAQVELWRNGSLRGQTANDGAFDDTYLARGSYSYRICTVGTTACTPTVSVTF